MENGPFIDDFLIKTSIYKGFSMAMLNNQRVNIAMFIINQQTNIGFFPTSKPFQAIQATTSWARRCPCRSQGQWCPWRKHTNILGKSWKSWENPEEIMKIQRNPGTIQDMSWLKKRRNIGDNMWFMIHQLVKIRQLDWKNWYFTSNTVFFLWLMIC